MIQSVNKICTACHGLGEVEGIQKVVRNPNNPLDIPIEKEVDRDSIKCYVCKGKGYIPTGFFIIILTSAKGSIFIEELEILSEDLKRAIKLRV